MNTNLKMSIMLNAIKKPGIAQIIAASDVGERMTKKCRKTGEPRPIWLDGLVCYTKSVVALGFDYNDVVRNEMARGIGDPFLWEEKASTVSMPDPDSTNGIVRRGIKNPEQKYVRIFIDMGRIKIKPESIFINAFGDDVTDRITDDIRESYFRIEHGSVKQLEAGALNEVKPREYKLENFMGIVCEEIEYISEAIPTFVKEKFGV